MKFAARLKQLRKEKGLSQYYLADYMVVSQVTISNWERGAKEPNYKSLIDLANLFGVTCDYLLGVNDDNNTSQ